MPFFIFENALNTERHPTLENMTTSSTSNDQFIPFYFRENIRNDLVECEDNKRIDNIISNSSEFFSGTRVNGTFENIDEFEKQNTPNGNKVEQISFEKKDELNTSSDSTAFSHHTICEIDLVEQGKRCLSCFKTPMLSSAPCMQPQPKAQQDDKSYISAKLNKAVTSELNCQNIDPKKNDDKKEYSESPLKIKNKSKDNSSNIPVKQQTRLTPRTPTGLVPSSFKSAIDKMSLTWTPLPPRPPQEMFPYRGDFIIRERNKIQKKRLKRRKSLPPKKNIKNECKKTQERAMEKYHLCSPRGKKQKSGFKSPLSITQHMDADKNNYTVGNTYESKSKICKSFQQKMKSESILKKRENRWISALDDGASYRLSPREQKIKRDLKAESISFIRSMASERKKRQEKNLQANRKEEKLKQDMPPKQNLSDVKREKTCSNSNDLKLFPFQRKREHRIIQREPSSKPKLGEKNAMMKKNARIRSHRFSKKINKDQSTNKSIKNEELLLMKKRVENLEKKLAALGFDNYEIDCDNEKISIKENFENQNIIDDKKMEISNEVKNMIHIDHQNQKSVSENDKKHEKESFSYVETFLKEEKGNDIISHIHESKQITTDHLIEQRIEDNMELNDNTYFESITRHAIPEPNKSIPTTQTNQITSDQSIRNLGGNNNYPKIERNGLNNNEILENIYISLGSLNDWSPPM